MNDEERRVILVRARARKFANMVRNENMAFLIPEEDFDWLKDTEIEVYKAHLVAFRIVQRQHDLRWERRA